MAEAFVLGALLENLPLKTVLRLYEDETIRECVFSTAAIQSELHRDLTKCDAKYNAEKKLLALRSVLPSKGDVSLPQVASGIRSPGAAADLHVLIISFDYDHNRERFFRSSPSGAGSWGEGRVSEVTLAEAIHVSTRPAKLPTLPYAKGIDVRRGRTLESTILFRLG